MQQQVLPYEGKGCNQLPNEKESHHQGEGGHLFRKEREAQGGQHIDAMQFRLKPKHNHMFPVPEQQECEMDTDAGADEKIKALERKTKDVFDARAADKAKEATEKKKAKAAAKSLATADATAKAVPPPKGKAKAKAKVDATKHIVPPVSLKRPAAALAHHGVSEKRPSAVLGTEKNVPQPTVWGGGKIYTSHTIGGYRVKKRIHHKVDDKVLWRSHGGYKGAWEEAPNKIQKYTGD